MFVNKLCDMNGEIEVFWVDGMMYVNDEYEHQVTENTGLYEAYKFSKLINASNFDYDKNELSKEELTEFNKKCLLDEFNENDNYIPIEINGTLHINNVKYEYVDIIVITDKELLIYYQGIKIGSILRKNIKSVYERNFEEGLVTDIIDNLIHLFDITIEGEF